MHIVNISNLTDTMHYLSSLKNYWDFRSKVYEVYNIFCYKYLGHIYRITKLIKNQSMPKEVLIFQITFNTHLETL